MVVGARRRDDGGTEGNGGLETATKLSLVGARVGGPSCPHTRGSRRGSSFGEGMTLDPTVNEPSPSLEKSPRPENVKPTSHGTDTTSASRVRTSICRGWPPAITFSARRGRFVDARSADDDAPGKPTVVVTRQEGGHVVQLAAGLEAQRHHRAVAGEVDGLLHRAQVALLHEVERSAQHLGGVHLLALGKLAPMAGHGDLEGLTLGGHVPQQLVHPTPAAFDYFGTSVAVSGDTVLVGSPRTDSSGLGDSGAAYVFVRTGTTWTKQAELLAGDIRIQGQFGSSVALDGNEAVIGAPWQWSSGFSPRSGEVYVFSRSGTTWTQTASLQAADGAMDDYLGTSVAFFGNLLVAGAPGVDLPAAKTAAGAAYLFARSGSTWTQAAKLTAPDAAKDDGFGTAVGAASDTVAIAAPGADLPSKTEAGAVYLFTNGAGSWALRTKLVASDAAAAQSFGYGLSLSDDTLVVGASGSAIAGKTSAGAGYVYAAVAAKTDGTACTDASECQSNFCVDGVCCSSACGGGDAGDCQACAVAKGAVRDGVCAPVKMGTT